MKEKESNVTLKMTTTEILRLLDVLSAQKENDGTFSVPLQMILSISDDSDAPLECRFEVSPAIAREPGYLGLYESQILPHVKLGTDRWGLLECEHMPANELTYQYELVWIERESGNKEEIRMCCPCYQKLRKLDLAPKTGTWEGLDSVKEQLVPKPKQNRV